MSSTLANAGRSKIYNTDGTGRDTYIGFSSGGFLPMKTNAPGERGGRLGSPMKVLSKETGNRSPHRTVHYAANGSGRDSYIGANSGGFASHYSIMNDRDIYVKSLRGYDEPI